MINLIIDLLNPLFWFSIFWLIFDYQFIIILKDIKSYYKSYYACTLIAVISIICSLMTVIKIISNFSGSEALGWDLQFGFMPIPPGGTDRIPGLTYIGDFLLVILYPLINGILGFCGFIIVTKWLKRPRNIQLIAGVVSLLGLIMGKIWFEFKVLSNLYYQ